MDETECGMAIPFDNNQKNESTWINLESIMLSQKNHITSNSIHILFRTGKSIVTESRLVIARGSREVELEVTSNGYWVSFQG